MANGILPSKMVFKNLILAILVTDCKKMATISIFVSNKGVPVTWVLATDRQS
jgi:hypothetical protein